MNWKVPKRRLFVAACLIGIAIVYLIVGCIDYDCAMASAGVWP
jgi:hypothetical protein